MSFKIYPPTPERCREISGFTSACGILVGHEPHFYRIIIDYFGDTAFIAEDTDGKIIGFTFGFASQTEPDLFFLWQIGVADDMRRNGLASKLLAHLIEAAVKKGCKRVRATVNHDNEPSRRLFEKAGFKNLGRFPNFYFEGEEMIIYEKDV